MATPARGPWPRWLLIVALALGVLAMHHLPDAPIQRAGSAGAMAMTPGSHLGSGAPDRPAMAPANGQDCPGMDMMGHLCLAVLDSAHAPAAPAPAAASPWAWPPAPPVLTSRVSALDARAPPPTSSARLSQLGVWRR